LARKYADKYRYKPGADDLLQNTLLLILEHWHTFRGETYEAGSGFYKWIAWRMRSVCSNDARVPTNLVDNPTADAVVPPAQEHAAELALVRDKLSAMPQALSLAVLRTAIGIGCTEQAAELGMAPSGISERARRGRRELRGETFRKRAFKTRGKVAA